MPIWFKRPLVESHKEFISIYLIYCSDFLSLCLISWECFKVKYTLQIHLHLENHSISQNLTIILEWLSNWICPKPLTSWLGNFYTAYTSCIFSIKMVEALNTKLILAGMLQKFIWLPILATQDSTYSLQMLPDLQDRWVSRGDANKDNFSICFSAQCGVSIIYC